MKTLVSRELVGENFAPMNCDLGFHDLTDKHALITGASRGIGRAIAELFAKAGANVAIHYHEHQEAAQKVARKAKSLGREAIVLRADMGSPQDIWQMFDVYDAEFDALDLVVCNAGIWKRTPIESMSEADLQEMFSVNLEGVIHTCRLAVQRMINQGTGGSLVLITSASGQRGEAFYSHYAATKGALIAFTKSLAVELAPHKIRVNAIAPGWIRTDMTTDHLDGVEGPEIRKKIPLGDAGLPEDVARPALFLVSEMARYITGEVLSVNGGSVLTGF